MALYLQGRRDVAQAAAVFPKLSHALDDYLLDRLWHQVTSFSDVPERDLLRRRLPPELTPKHVRSALARLRATNRGESVLQPVAPPTSGRAAGVPPVHGPDYGRPYSVRVEGLHPPLSLSPQEVRPGLIYPRCRSDHPSARQ